ncbi:hypothetical protein [Duganella sp. P38]|uniref:hypothetical protein n=1 Tax=Duganella sp. P38 TaxID=3423949 RepID=UPI003D7B47A9
MQAVDKWAARVLLLNSGLALAVSLGLLGEPLDGQTATVAFGTAMLGFVAAVLSLRRHPAGLWAALPYYAVQSVSYFPFAGTGFSVKAGVSIGLVLQFKQAVVVLNVLALLLLGVTIALLVWRRRLASR